MSAQLTVGASKICAIEMYRDERRCHDFLHTTFTQILPAEHMNKWTDKWRDKWRQTKRQMNRQMNEQMNRKMNRRMNTQMNKWTDKWTDKCRYLLNTTFTRLLPEEGRRHDILYTTFTRVSQAEDKCHCLLQRSHDYYRTNENSTTYWTQHSHTYYQQNAIKGHYLINTTFTQQLLPDERRRNNFFHTILTRI